MPYIVDFDRWAKCATWTIQEAAALALGEHPKEAEESNTHRNHRLFERYKDMLDLVQRARDAGELRPRPTPREFLEWARHYDVRVASNLVQAVERIDAPLLSCRERCIALEQEVSELRAAIDQMKMDRPRWPWGNYTTELLEKLYIAGDEWWSDYDPEHREKAPTINEVADWLRNQKLSDGKPLARRVAEVMAQILKADDVPPGPRTTRRK